MDEACARVVGDVVSVEQGDGKFIAAGKILERMIANHRSERRPIQRTALKRRHLKTKCPAKGDIQLPILYENETSMTVFLVEPTSFRLNLRQKRCKIFAPVANFIGLARFVLT